MNATRILTYVSKPDTGYEPYITDFVTKATSLVGNINRGSGSSEPGTSTSNDFAALAGGRTIFGASDGTGTTQPWVTDGTAADTQELISINPGGTYPFATMRGNSVDLAGSGAKDFVALSATQVLFNAFDVTHGYSLWVTDGTAAGTTLVDNNPGAGEAGYITPLGDGRALFESFDPIHGYEPWITNGTTAGTMFLADLVPGSTGSYPTGFAALGSGRAIFAANDDTGVALWTTDGTAVGTTEFVHVEGARDLKRLASGIVVFGSFVSDSYQLWVTDGSAAGTKAILTGGATSLSRADSAASGISDDVVKGFGILGDGRAEFIYSPTVGIQQLWVTDGTAAGTTLVKDLGATGPFSLYQSSGSTMPGFVSLSNGQVAFAARVFDTNMSSYDDALWTSDGTASGTTVLNDFPTIAIGGLQGSALVDAPFYIAHNPDVGAAGIGAGAHYDGSGWHEGRDPDAFFSTNGYLDTYTDVKAAGVDPLTHYDSNGWQEGRDRLRPSIRTFI